MDEGVVAHVRGVKWFDGQVGCHIIELVVTSCDEAAIFVVKVVGVGEGGVAPITIEREV